MRRASLAFALATALPATALAQAYQCSVPGTVPAPPAPAQDGPRVAKAASAFVLAVSWSPEYCRADKDPVSIQCSGRNGRFGFVVHGLWPEAGRGAAPQWCRHVPPPRAEVFRRNLCMTPVPWLIAHEWAKHGSCIAPSAEAYYAATRSLWERLDWPDAAALSRRKGLTVGNLREAVALANPGMPQRAIGVLLNERGWLRELRICYSRKYRYRHCGVRAFGPTDSQPLKIWRGV